MKMQNYTSGEILQISKTLAKHYGVSDELHSEDMILRFLLDNPCFPDQKSALNYYFNTGQDSTKNLISILTQLGVGRRPISLFEFASGYGCVSRHLLNQPNWFNLTICDIHTEAIDFLSHKLGVGRAVLSTSKPEDLAPGEKFDVVFALSFFSHMPKTTWGRWLESLYDKVDVGGYLIFTTQGVKSAHYFGNPLIPNDGFWFKDTSEQKDLDVSEYGQTICTYEFVNGEVNQRLKVPIAMYKYGYWWEHQDLYAIKKF
jgi:hypothetical protein